MIRELLARHTLDKPCFDDSKKSCEYMGAVVLIDLITGSSELGSTLPQLRGWSPASLSVGGANGEKSFSQSPGLLRQCLLPQPTGVATRVRSTLQLVHCVLVDPYR